MKSLFAIFLLPATLFCHFLDAADFVSHPDAEGRFALRRLVGCISGNFRVAKKSLEVDILSDSKAVPGEPFWEYMPDKRVRITINPADDWMQDRGFCRKLVFLLLKFKTGSPAVNGDALPDWFVFGIAQAAKERTASARLARNSHNFELLELLVTDGSFRNPLHILPLKLSALTPEEVPFFLEYAKLAVYALENAGKFPNFAAILTESRSLVRSDFDRVAAECLKNYDSKYVAPEFRKELWGDLNPPPEDFTLKCFEAACKIPVPELDKDGLPTGKIGTVALHELPALSERPDYHLLCRYAAKEIFAVSVGESREVRRALAGLRVMFEQDFMTFAAAAGTGKAQNSSTDPRAKAKKEQQKRAGKGAASFDELMNNQEKSEFRELTRKFYKEKVLSGTAPGGGNRSVRSGLGNLMPVRAKAEPENIRRIAENIRQLLAERKALRSKLDSAAARERSVRENIRRRSIFLENSDDRISGWLEQLENSLL